MAPHEPGTQLKGKPPMTDIVHYPGYSRPKIGVLLLLGVLALAAAAPTPAPAAQPQQQGLVGRWYWEYTTYVSAGDYSMLIRSTKTLILRADGTFEYVVTGTNTATQVYRGTYTQQGNRLVFTDASGQSVTFAFELRGNNGLVVGGTLFERR